jgi:O-antigen/teichoic acid export membrane protein/polysaccharide pyruvyl transferase WcaK-like protein
MMVSRFLGKERAGEFFLSMTLTVILATLARWGLDNAVTRNAAAAQTSKQFGALSFILTYAGTFTAITSAIVTVLLAVTARPLALYAFHDPNLTRPLQLTAASILPLALYSIYFQFLQGLGKVRAAMLLNSFWPQVFMVLTAGIALKRFGVDGAVTAYTFGCVASVVVGYFYTRQSSEGPAFDKSLVRKALLKGCNSLFLASVSELLISWVPVVFVGIYGSLHQVAEFAVGQRLSNLLGFFFYAVNTTVSSKIASDFHLGRMDVVGRVIRHSAIIMTVGALPVFLAFTVFPKFVLHFFGDGFVTGASILIALSLGQMINVVTGPVASALVMCGKERVYSKIQLFSAVLACGLVLYGLHVNGAFGAAVGVAVAIAVKNLLCSFYVWTTLGVAPISFGFSLDEQLPGEQRIDAPGKRIVLVGYYGSNFGDLIMLKALLDVFREKRAAVSIFTYGAISPAVREIAGDFKLVALNQSSRIRSLWQFLSASIGARAVVWGGGTCFMDEGGEGGIKYFLPAMILGTSIHYFGIGVGNTKRLKTRLYLRLARLASKRIVVRDRESAGKLGGLSDAVRIAPDLCFALDRNGFAAKQTTPAKTLLVAYRSLNEYLSSEEAERVLSLFCDRLEELIEAEAYSSVQVMDTDADVDGGDSDLIFSRLIKHTTNVIRLNGASPLDKLNCIASASVVVTGRLHVGVFAAEAGVPFLIVNYSPKIETFARSAGAAGSLVSYSELNEPLLFVRRAQELRKQQVSLPGANKNEILLALEEMYAAF